MAVPRVREAEETRTVWGVWPEISPATIAAPRASAWAMPTELNMRSWSSPPAGGSSSAVAWRSSQSVLVGAISMARVCLMLNASSPNRRHG